MRSEKVRLSDDGLKFNLDCIKEGKTQPDQQNHLILLLEELQDLRQVIDEVEAAGSAYLQSRKVVAKELDWDLFERLEQALEKLRKHHRS